MHPQNIEESFMAAGWRRTKKLADTPYDVAAKMKTMGIHRVALCFSCGKDSLAAWCALRQEGIEVVPIYNYLYPDLAFIEETLQSYECLFETRIHRIPHTAWLEIFRNLLFLDPYLVRCCEEVGTTRAPALKKLTDDYLEEIGLGGIMVCTGMKACDGSIRRLAIAKSGPINLKARRAYPCAYAGDKRVYSMLVHHGVPLPSYYKVFGESIDVLKPAMLNWVKENYPEDWDKILTVQPLIELEIARLKVTPLPD